MSVVSARKYHPAMARKRAVYVLDINSVVEWLLQAEGAVVETIAAVLSRTKPFDPAFCWTISRPGWKLV